MNSFDDPEGSYRRGYKHGAWALFEAFDHHLSPTDREIVKKWLRDVGRWRLDGLQGKSVRKKGSVTFNGIEPPTKRLTKLQQLISD